MSRHSRIRMAAVLLAAGVVAASCQKRVAEPGEEAFQTVGALQVVVASAPDPPRQGDNALTIRVRDADGKPVHGAVVSAVVSMAAMGAMPAMESRGKVRETQPGTYRAEYGLAMNGEWDVAIRIQPKTGPPAEAAYRLSTTTGLSFTSGTPTAGGVTSTATDTAGGPAGAVRIDAARRQEIGIRTAPVSVRDLSVAVRAAGRVSFDEKRQAEVALKFAGWVRDLQADFTGRLVRAGEVLFTAYSPELWTAQQEYLEALRLQGDSTSAARGEARSELAAAARRRLLLWDIPPSAIQAIAREGRPREALPIVAPITGVVVEKSVVRGSAFTAGQVLYKLAPVDPAWVIASVYPVDLPFLRVGMAATLTNPYLDERSRHGRVSFIAPTLTSETRTADVRVEVANPGGALKPGMFVDVELAAPLGRRLALPESAVLPTGERRLVFVDLGDGRLAPREVRLGAHAGEYYEVLDGLRAGDVVVTSGNFLVAAESRLKSAAVKW